MSDDVQGPDGGLPEWAKILIGVLVGVTGAILIGLAIFCIHRKMKANKQQQNT